MRKRILSFLLCIAIAITSVPAFPTTVHAAGGSGAVSVKIISKKRSYMTPVLMRVGVDNIEYEINGKKYNSYDAGESMNQYMWYHLGHDEKLELAKHYGYRVEAKKKQFGDTISREMADLIDEKTGWKQLRDAHAKRVEKLYMDPALRQIYSDDINPNTGNSYYHDTLMFFSPQDEWFVNLPVSRAGVQEIRQQNEKAIDYVRYGKSAYDCMVNIHRKRLCTATQTSANEIISLIMDKAAFVPAMAVTEASDVAKELLALIDKKLNIMETLTNKIFFYKDNGKVASFDVAEEEFKTYAKLCDEYAQECRSMYSKAVNIMYSVGRESTDIYNTIQEEEARRAQAEENFRNAMNNHVYPDPFYKGEYAAHIKGCMEDAAALDGDRQAAAFQEIYRDIDKVCNELMLSYRAWYETWDAKMTALVVADIMPHFEKPITREEYNYYYEYESYFRVTPDTLNDINAFYNKALDFMQKAKEYLDGHRNTVQSYIDAESATHQDFIDRFAEFEAGCKAAGYTPASYKKELEAPIVVEVHVYPDDINDENYETYSDSYCFTRNQGKYVPEATYTFKTPVEYMRAYYEELSRVEGRCGYTHHNISYDNSIDEEIDMCKQQLAAINRKNEQFYDEIRAYTAQYNEAYDSFVVDLAAYKKAFEADRELIHSLPQWVKDQPVMYDNASFSGWVELGDLRNMQTVDSLLGIKEPTNPYLYNLFQNTPDEEKPKLGQKLAADLASPLYSHLNYEIEIPELYEKMENDHSEMRYYGMPWSYPEYVSKLGLSLHGTIEEYRSEVWDYEQYLTLEERSDVKALEKLYYDFIGKGYSQNRMDSFMVDLEANRYRIYQEIKKDNWSKTLAEMNQLYYRICNTYEDYSYVGIGTGGAYGHSDEYRKLYNSISDGAEDYIGIARLFKRSASNRSSDSSIHAMGADNPMGAPGEGTEPEYDLTLTEGEISTLQVGIEPANAMEQEIIWDSYDPEIALVDECGNVTAVSEGTARIVAHPVASIAVPIDKNGNEIGTNSYGTLLGTPVDYIHKVWDENGNLVSGQLEFTVKVEGGYSPIGADSLALSDEEGHVLNDIPASGSFYVTVPVKEDVGGIVLLGAYDMAGALTEYHSLAPSDGVAKIKVENADDDVRGIKAFLVDSVQSLKPLGKAASFSFLTKEPEEIDWGYPDEPVRDPIFGEFKPSGSSIDYNGTTPDGGSVEEPEAAEATGTAEEPDDGMTEEPETIEEPEKTEEPDVTEEKEVTEEPEAVEEPGKTEEPGATKEPGKAEEPGTAEATGTPEDQPVVTEMPPATERSEVSEELAVSAESAADVTEMSEKLDIFVMSGILSASEEIPGEPLKEDVIQEETAISEEQGKPDESEISDDLIEPGEQKEQEEPEDAASPENAGLSEEPGLSFELEEQDAGYDPEFDDPLIVKNPADTYFYTYHSASAGKQYLLLVIEGEHSSFGGLTDDDGSVLYIDQKTAAGEEVPFDIVIDPAKGRCGTIIIAGEGMEPEIVGYLGLPTEISASKVKTEYNKGDTIGGDDVAVYLKNSDGTETQVTGWTSNIAELSCETAGIKELIISYTDPYSGRTFTCSIDLFVKDPDKEYVRVYFDMQDGSGVTSVPVEKNSSLSGLPQEPGRKGYRFAGWYLDRECTEAFDEKSVINTDTTLYAKWEKTGIKLAGITVKLAHNTFPQGEMLTENDIEVLAKYENGTSAYVHSFTTDLSAIDQTAVGVKTLNVEYTENGITRNASVKFRITEGTSDRVRVVFDAGCDYSVPAVYVAIGSLLDEPDIPEREGYKFVGWYNGDKPWDFGVDTVSAGMTLRAKWLKAAGETGSDTYCFLEEIGDRVYTGKAIVPGVAVMDRNMHVLKEGKDYTVKYTDNVNAGIAGATVTFKGNYTGTVSTQFNILPKDIADENTVPFKCAEFYAYKANGVKPSPVLKYNGKTLKNGMDYTVSFQKLDSKDGSAGTAVTAPLKEAGYYLMTVRGRRDNTNKPNNYTGERTFAFEIAPQGAKNLSAASVKLSKSKVPYTGDPIKIAPEKVAFGKTVLNADGESPDYKLIYPSDTTSCGKKTITVKALDTSGKCFGQKTYTYEVTGIPMKSAAVTIKKADYRGEKYEDDIIGPVTVRLNKTTAELLNTVKASEGIPYKQGDTYTLKYKTDYRTEFKNNLNAGKATVTLIGLGVFSGRVDKKFSIGKVSLKDGETDKSIEVEVECSNTDYDTENKPYGYELQNKAGACPKKVTVTYKTGRDVIELTEGKDYKLIYSQNKKAGTAAVTVKGTGSFTGSCAPKQYEIRKKPLDDPGISVTVINPAASDKKYPYGYMPTLIVYDNGVLLKANKDYIFTGYRPVSYERYNEGVRDGSVILYGVNNGSYENADYGHEIPYSVGTYDIGDTKCTITVKPQTYKGEPFVFTKNDSDSYDADILSQFDAVYITPDGSRKTLVLGTDFDIISYSKNGAVGTAKVCLKGIGDFAGTRTVSFKIVKQTIADD